MEVQALTVSCHDSFSVKESPLMDKANSSEQKSNRLKWWNWGKFSRTIAESSFLAGPRTRLQDFKSAFEIFFELIGGFRKLHFVGPCVTVFGSARVAEDSHYYICARQVGQKLASLGFTVMTGGGPGIMEAANRGAKDVNGFSIGLNITLAHEQKPNPYLDQWVEFKYFMIRKLLLVKYSYGFIAAPGGFGTMDEIFSLLTLIQTQKVKDFPVVLLGREFWEPLRAQIQEKFVQAKTIDAEDSEKILFTDSVDEAVEYIHRMALHRFGLELNVRARRPLTILGEQSIRK